MKIKQCGTNIGIYLSMNHAKPMRGVGIVPQGKFDLNTSVDAPNWCISHKISMIIVQSGFIVRAYASALA
jgi:hypothetical protein